MGTKDALEFRLGRLLAMITDFQQIVAQANGLLQMHLDLANPMYYRQANVHREGFLGSGQSHKNYPEFKDKRVLEDAFQEAIRKGLIHQPYLSLQDWLYYLK